MFSSTNCVNLCLHPSSSSRQYDPPEIIDHETNGLLVYHHHHNPLIAAPWLPTNPSIAEPESFLGMGANSNHAMNSKQDFGLLIDRYQLDHPDFLPLKRPAKKDRHSKINTAQGLRDRRVRLSIGIARKFFDLQDMLGFEKASETLDWLLTKSRKAIKELAQDGTSMCEVVSEADDDLEETVSKTQPLGAVSNEKKTKKLQKSTMDPLIKESRAKARARARERTRVKMFTRSVRESSDKCPDTSPHMANQYQGCGKSGSTDDQQKLTCSVKNAVHEADEHLTSNSLYHQVRTKEDAVEGSIMMKRKLKASTIMGYQKNLDLAKEVISCSKTSDHHGSNYCLPSLPPNWDISNALTRSSLVAITNMNLSTGLQIYGKLWDADQTNQYQQK
ncbi:hypothetical protein K2173_025804 [Erythroxylum novogranatense]|uniref:Uncharacterized protein n=1 Tax=Erythroxylum novogranatense TaxID=1862640 RepID=A0AAV8SHA9_9ROSI|nr:hypothetical protein K2173_025804 [Erythroxylum novogranatense]